MEFAVGVSNLGPTLAPAVSLADALPAGLTYVSDSTTAGAYVDSSGVWSVGDLANGAAEILWITATVDSGTAGTTLQIRYGEMLHPDGRLMTENLRKARATDNRGDGQISGTFGRAWPSTPPTAWLSYRPGTPTRR